MADGTTREALMTYLTNRCLTFAAAIEREAKAGHYAVAARLQTIVDEHVNYTAELIGGAGAGNRVRDALAKHRALRAKAEARAKRKKVRRG